MRKQYTASPVKTRQFSSRRRRVYPDSLPCEHCREPFKPTKDRKRFCSYECFKNWEKARSRQSADCGHSQGGKVVPKDVERGESYAERCRFWIEEAERQLSNGWVPDDRKPLILNGHGASLGVRSGALTVRDGLTHHPQERKEFKVFPGRHNTPSRIVMLGHSGSVSIDALLWLSAQKVPLIVLDHRGRELSCLCTSTGAVDPDLRLAQMVALRPEHATELSKDLIRAKIAGCLDNLGLFVPRSLSGDAEPKLLRSLEQLDSASTVAEVMLIEASAAAAYFALWQSVELRWSAKSLDKIPHAWRSGEQRESKVSGSNRHASHPLNALMNYGFGLLESQVRITLASKGIDPAISYLHSIKAGRDGLVYDLMEPLRPTVERAVLGLANRTTFSISDFVTDVNGVCRLNPEFAKKLANADFDLDCESIVAKFSKAVTEGRQDRGLT